MSISTENLLERINASSTGFSVARILLRLGSRSEEMRSKMLEFMAVLPTLKNSRRVAEYAVMYLGPYTNKLPILARLGFIFTRYPITSFFAGWIIRKMIVLFLAPYFIAKDEEKLAKLYSKYSQSGASVVIDVLGEAVLSYSEADEYINHICSLIEANSGKKKKLYIAVKFSSFYPHFYPVNYKEAKRNVSEVFTGILRSAKKNNVHITVDVEDSQVIRLTEDIFFSVVCSTEFSGVSDVAIALQAYRKDSMASAFDIVSAARKRGTPIGVRLVKGAYWDTEMIDSEKKGWQPPLFREQQETDAMFLKITEHFLLNRDRVRFSCGTHNPESIASVIRIEEETRSSKWTREESLEFQFLLGIGDPVWPALASLGFSIRIFIPIMMKNVTLEEVMAYFARRLQENTASNGAAFASLGVK